MFILLSVGFSHGVVWHYEGEVNLCGWERMIKGWHG